MTKKSPMVVKVIAWLHHKNFKVVEFVMELYHGSAEVVRLVLRPHYIDFHFYVS